MSISDEPTTISDKQQIASDNIHTISDDRPIESDMTHKSTIEPTNQTTSKYIFIRATIT